MNLAGLALLALDHTKVGDAELAHFKDCKSLNFLGLRRTEVGDTGLAHFKDCKNLKYLYLGCTQVSDAGLENLKGMPLKKLMITHTAVADLTPLQGMALEDVCLTPKNITQGVEILRDMKNLKTIGISWENDNAWSAAEFWERYDKGEFKK